MNGEAKGSKCNDFKTSCKKVEEIALYSLPQVSKTDSCSSKALPDVPSGAKDLVRVSRDASAQKISVKSALSVPSWGIARGKQVALVAQNLLRSPGFVGLNGFPLDNGPSPSISCFAV
jgi:hypothetical protein